MTLLAVVLKRTRFCSCLPARQLSLWHPQLPPSSPRAATTYHQHIPLEDVAVFYRWPTIRHFRLLSRCKLYQVVLMSLLLPPATLSYQQGSLPSSTLTAAYLAAGGTLTVLLSLSHLFTKVIGEMAYLPATGQVRISTLTFLGNRRTIVVHPQHILPQGGRGVVQKLEIVGYGEFGYSVRYGQVIDADLMAQILQL